jgi:hypothetical protein
MARIHIDDLPVAENLTPEQEALLLGAGLRPFRPSLEHLETREVPTVTPVLGADGVLTIQGTAANDRAHVSIQGDQVVAVINTERLSVKATDVKEIVFHGGAGDDTFYNFTDKKVTAHGGEGNDALFSRGDAELRGGAGADRILVMHGSKPTTDAADPKDAVLTFQNGSRDWTNEEIERVDAAFAILHKETGNTALLKTKAGGALTFYRSADLKEGDLGANDNRGTIRLSDLALNRPVGVVGTVLHEIGHNWDTENDNWTQFLEMNGWTKTPPSSPEASLNFSADKSVNVRGSGGELMSFQRNDSGGYTAQTGTEGTLETLKSGGYRLTGPKNLFAYYDSKGQLAFYDVDDASGTRISYSRTDRYKETWYYKTDSASVSSYAKEHPEEDFAESFAAHFLQKAGQAWDSGGPGAAGIPDKVKFFDNMVAKLKQTS